MKLALRIGLIVLAALAAASCATREGPLLFSPAMAIAGEPLWARHCAGCHEGTRPSGPSPRVLQSMGSRKVYRALKTGKMKDRAMSLTDTQKRQIAAYAAARRLP